MINLDNLEAVKGIDKSDLYESVIRLAKQIKQAWEEVKRLDLPEKCSLASNIVVAGMGGSALGGRIVDSLLEDRVRVPIEISTQAQLPNYIRENSLVIISSYSGNTEETLACLNQAQKKRAEIFVITTSGKLKELASKYKLEGYFFNPKENPSNQPRMGLGYSIASTLAILSRCNFIHLTDEEINNCLKTVETLSQEFSREVDSQHNLAKKIAQLLKYKAPVLIASQHLLGACHAFKNQLNENAKTFSTLYDLPEANHHLMEGFKNPAEIKKNLLAFLVTSELYSEFVKKRYPLTREVIDKNEISTFTYQARSRTKIEQLFEIITLGSYVSYYLAVLYQTDPTPIPWVDYFKSKLK